MFDNSAGDVFWHQIAESSIEKWLQTERDLHLKMQFPKLKFGWPLKNKEESHVQLHPALW